MKSNKPAPRTPKSASSLTKKSAAVLGQVVRVLKNPLNGTKPAGGPAPVALTLRAPAAKEVFVAGSFNGWQVGATPLRPAKSGEWQGELKLSPGRYEYLFVVDGTWLPDPAAREAAPNPFGGWNSVLSVN
jgi:1,4-alpha-glucan branching enzyme